MRKGIVGVGLAVALTGAVAAPVITAAPVAAYAEETSVEVTDAAALQDALTAGKSVKLTANITGSVTVPAGVSVTIDLNGYTIAATKKWAAITNNGALVVTGTGTVDGSSLASTGALYNAPGATATLKGGTFTGSKWYVIKNLGGLIIDGATVNQQDAGSSAIDNGWYGSKSNDCNLSYPSSGTVESLGVSLEIKSGLFTGGMNVVKNDDYAKLDISGGTFTNTNGPAILNWSEATIFGGDFSVKDEASGVIANGSYQTEADKGELTITGGTFTAPNGGTGTVIARGVGGKNGGTVTLDGGAYKGDFSGTANLDITASIGEGVEFSDLNTLKSAAGYVSDGFAVETTDGNTFTVKKMETARDESTSLIECNFVSGKTTAIYFSGDNAEESASNFIGGNDTDGDGINDDLEEYIVPAEASKVTINILRVVDDDQTNTVKVSSQELTPEELKAGQISLDISTLQQTKPEREGYAFARWTAYLIDELDDQKTSLQEVEGTTLEVPFTKDDLAQYVKNADGTVDVDVLFFPSWYAPVCFTFDTNGGEKLNDERKATDSKGLVTINKVTDLPTPVREGYTFKGWEEYALNEDTDEPEWTAITYPFVVGQDNSGEELTITLRAVWKKNAETPSDPNASNNTTVKTAVTTETTKSTDAKAKAKVLPATGDSAAAALAVVAGAGTVVVAAGVASRRRNNA